MLRKSLMLILAMIFVFAGSEALAGAVCANVNLNASPNIFKADQTINFKIGYYCSDEIKDVEIQILYRKVDGTKSDVVASKFGVKLSKGTHSVDVSGNGFKGGQGTFVVVFKKQGASFLEHNEETVCRSWSIGKY
jgi:hypothetical protein